jgi:hypothetical protein
MRKYFEHEKYDPEKLKELTGYLRVIGKSLEPPLNLRSYSSKMPIILLSFSEREMTRKLTATPSNTTINTQNSRIF